MNSAFSSLVRFASGKLLSLVVIACILALGNVVYTEWKTLASAAGDRSTLAGIVDGVKAFRHEESTASVARMAALQGASTAVLESRIGELEQSLQADSADAGVPLLSFPLKGDIVRRRAERKIRSEVLRQELHYLKQVRAYARAGTDRRAALARLELLRASYVEINARYFDNRRLRVKLASQALQRIAHPLATHARLKALENESERLAADNQRAMQAYLAQRTALSHMRALASVQAYVVDGKRLDAITAPLDRHLAAATEAVTGNWLARLFRPVAGMLPAAGILLLGSFGLHLAFKAFFFFVLAPLAARLKPVCLDPNAEGRIAARDSTCTHPAMPVTSARSQPVCLNGDEQLLVLPQYVQSIPVHAVKDTKWLLDWTVPMTSLMSGMFALERIRAKRPDPIVLSSSDDPLSEIALLSIPAGAAMTFQPRGMVGVIYSDSSPLKITRRWRLGSLHAWLTLQFRYLIFRGPVTLVVRGTRGVRVEPAGDGRAISQAATLGFSANVSYSTARGGAFFPYYQGKSALLQDSFQGNAGYYVYDETPRGGKGTTAVGRGLDGVADALLKAFGI